MFHQDDDHTFLMEDQIGDEIADIMKIADQIYGTLGLTYRAELSTRPDDFMGDVALWDKAEASLKKILDETYGEGGYEINEGDGAFYGPKIDLQMKDALGREWQMGTIQLDFQLPGNFGLKYAAADGTLKQPVMIHRAIFGSMERFIGILIENFKGAFPFWLAPTQVALVPIHEEHNEYAREVEGMLRDRHIRVKIDDSDKNMMNKIKNYKKSKVPYVIVIGDKEVAERSVSLNIRGSNKQLNDVPLEDFLDLCINLERNKDLELIQEIN